MQTPNILTPFGFLPVTCLSDGRLVEAYLSVADGLEDADVVQLLRYALSSEDEKAGAILRLCLSGGGSLVPVYPVFGQTPPSVSERLGDIMDGGLYLVLSEYKAESLNNKSIFDFTGDAALIERITGFLLLTYGLLHSTWGAVVTLLIDSTILLKWPQR